MHALTLYYWPRYSETAKTRSLLDVCVHSHRCLTDLQMWKHAAERVGVQRAAS